MANAEYGKNADIVNVCCCWFQYISNLRVQHLYIHARSKQKIEKENKTKKFEIVYLWKN